MLRQSIVILFLASCLIGGASWASTDEPESEKEKKQKSGFRLLPIPVFITEPAIGEGLGIALSLFHPSKGDGEEERPRASTPNTLGKERMKSAPPPITTTAFGAYTSNGTSAFGVGHVNHFRQDSIRYTGVIAAANLVSEFYLAEIPVGFKLEGALTYHDLRFRLGNSRTFLGASAIYLDADNSFNLDLGGSVPTTILETEIKDAGVAVQVSFEGRDNTTMPTRGQLFSLGVWRYDDAFGGNYDYWNARSKFLSFHPLHEKFVIGLRFEISAINGEPPFFGYPWVKLRGIPALRYQNELAGAAELEARWHLAERWTLSAFGGEGFTSGDASFAANDDDIYNYGGGARWKAFHAQNIWVGIDLAKGPEEWAWYVQVNQGW